MYPRNWILTFVNIFNTEILFGICSWLLPLNFCLHWLLSLTLTTEPDVHLTLLLKSLSLPICKITCIQWHADDHLVMPMTGKGFFCFFKRAVVGLFISVSFKLVGVKVTLLGFKSVFKVVWPQTNQFLVLLIWSLCWFLRSVRSSRSGEVILHRGGGEDVDGTWA